MFFAVLPPRERVAEQHIPSQTIKFVTPKTELLRVLQTSEKLRISREPYVVQKYFSHDDHVDLSIFYEIREVSILVEFYDSSEIVSKVRY